ncbi:MAG: tetratricopeptide repeat protein [Candidatus Kapaibacterium sp.]|jgi:TolA-binding protein
MKTEILTKKTKEKCRILSVWLIVTSFLLPIVFSACVPSKNLVTGERDGYRQNKLNASYSGGLVHSNKKRKKYSKKVSESQLQNDEIAMFEKRMIEASSNNIQQNRETKLESSNNPSERNTNLNAQAKTLPSLKEQIENLNKNQSEVESKIENIQGDMLEIKDLLESIAEKNVNNTSNISTVEVKQEKQTPVINKVEETGTFILESDEKANLKQTEQVKKTVEPKTFKKEKPVPVKHVKRTVPAKTVEKQDVISNEPQDKSQTQEISKTGNATNDFSDIINKVAKGEYDVARKHIQQIMKASKDEVDIANCHYWLGECNLKQKQYNKAIDNFKTVLNGKSDKKDSAQAKLAECYLRIGKNDEAKEAFQTLLQNYPRSSQTPRAKRMLQQL